MTRALPLFVAFTFPRGDLIEYSDGNYDSSPFFFFFIKCSVGSLWLSSKQFLRVITGYIRLVIIRV